MDKLFDLLEHLHSDKKQKRDIKTLTAWREVLNPWSYDQVRDAAFRRAQSGNRFFPDAPEIAAFCEPIKNVSWEADNKTVPAGWEKQSKALKRHKNLMERRRAAGLPGGLAEAQERGMTAAEFSAACDEAGMSVSEILEEIYGP